MNVRKEKSLQVHSASKIDLSKEWKTGTCRAQVSWRNFTSASESWLRERRCTAIYVAPQTVMRYIGLAS